MWDVFTVGLDMQKRMIDIQMQGMKAAQDMVTAAQKNVEIGKASHDAGEAGITAMKSWMRLWGVRD
ncbi:hypothetical protein PX699_19250 [Sphingobium sp. H39-3-25]|uniref:hypothetical protein n=1 Tax=Sphingobium arseniciresistens TaxID=3030834 RepID=UPI0023B8FB65|nr:hypothetical protein [Sphingobium arseniciresistens]